MDLIEYQTKVLAGQMEEAEFLLSKMPEKSLGQVAKFLDNNGFKDEALKVAIDPEHRFELAMNLKKLDVAIGLMDKVGSVERWNQLGNVALGLWNYSFAEECFQKAVNLPSLLLLYTSQGNKAGLVRVAEKALTLGMANMAFTCYFATGNISKCLEILVDSKRYAEAVFFAKTYLPHQLDQIVSQWKSAESGKKNVIADRIAEPLKNPELFPELPQLLKLEEEREHQVDSQLKSPEKKLSTVNQQSTNEPSPVSQNFSSSLNGNGQTNFLDVRPNEQFENVSDAFSLEVHTAGTNSMKGDDFDDVTMFNGTGTDTDADLMNRLSLVDDPVLNSFNGENFEVSNVPHQTFNDADLDDLLK